MKTCWITLLGSLLLLEGCGGNAGSNADSVGIDSTYGPVSTRSVGGVAEPVIMQGAHSSVTGVFGANFSNATVSLRPDNQLNEEELLATTTIAFSDSGRPVLLNYGTGAKYALNPESPIYSSDSSPSFSANGSLILTSEFDMVQAPELFLYASDGSSRIKVPYGGYLSNPNLNGPGTKITFAINYDIWTVNKDGASPQNLTRSDDYEFRPKWNPSGTKIGYMKYVFPTFRFWEMDAAGGGQVQKAVPILNITSWDYNPTGTEIVVVNTNDGFNRIDRCNLASGASQNIVTTTDELSDVTWSPEGSRVAYYRTNARGTSIESARLIDGSTSTILPATNRNSLVSLEWGPLVQKRSFIASSGSVLGATNAAGFLYGMTGDKFASFLAFDAVTRNTVDIDVPPPAGFNPSNHVATITATDKITMLRYVNEFTGTRISVVDPGSSSTYVQGAVVSFNANTGKVAAVLPFNRSRSGEKPTRTVQGGKVTYRGEFLGVWDDKGKKSNSPVTEVTMDANTGQVLSQH